MTTLSHWFWIHLWRCAPKGALAAWRMADEACSGKADVVGKLAMSQSCTGMMRLEFSTKNE